MDFESHRDSARAAREAARERLGPKLPHVLDKLILARSSPCDGWFAAADLCYDQATEADDIDTAIEWYIRGDAYATVGEACLETLKTL